MNVARPSRWGNPYRLFEGKHGGASIVKAKRLDNGEYVLMSSHSSVGGAYEHLFDLYAMWITRTQPLRELAGKDLACWCKPDQPCHADVLLEIANHPAP